MSIKVIFIIAAIIYYIYSAIKGNEAQKNKKSTANPTPSQKSTIDEILEKLLDQQKKHEEIEEKPVPNIPVNSSAPKKLVFKGNKTPASPNKKQGLPFEKRKLSDAREMPSRKQIERVVIREKKATEAPVIKVKDYDLDFLNHDLPHKEHHLSDQSKIKFHFKEDEAEVYEFDARQAIISQIILERKEF